jgi:acetyl esterase/lipase
MSMPDPVTGTKYKAASDMAAVLKTLKGLGGKPIETLTPAEARQQPTVADAVKAVSTAEGKDTDPVKLVPGVLPPVTIINAEIDPLRSDGELLQQALTQAGVKVDRKVYKGVTHEFFGSVAVVSEAKDAQTIAGDQLKAAFK